MRIAHLLVGATLAFAVPALAQTTPAPAAMPSPAATPTPMATPVPAATPAAGTPGTVTATPTVVNPAIGVKVFDPSGTEVGTIKALDAQYATIATANGDVKLPAAGVGPGPNGAAVGLTAAQIDAAVAQAAPARPAADATTTTQTKTTTTTKTRKKPKTR